MHSNSVLITVIPCCAYVSDAFTVSMVSAEAHIAMRLRVLSHSCVANPAVLVLNIEGIG